MSQIGELQRQVSGEKDLAELLTEFQEVDRFYREILAAISLPGEEAEPVRSSADVTVSFHPGHSSDLAAEKL